MPQSLSAKNKIIVVAIAWIVLSAVMLLFVFKIMDGKNQTALDDMAQDRQQLATLENENESFKLAQADLQQMDSEAVQPRDFFSKDINLVKEIQVLENLDGKFNTKVTFSGVSGVVGDGGQSSAPGTATAMTYIPYNISVNGALPDVVKLIQNFENLTFISKITSIALSSTGDGTVNAILGSGFYVENN